ncbi:MAG: methyltransferase, TrmH family [Actinomycetota bacterium]|nr:methyltransferase, TrmH family [Actinomycetota bacterium]
MQRARRLLKRSHRREDEAFLLEGNRALSDALAHGASVGEIFVTEELADDPIVTRAGELGAQIHVVGAPILKAVSASVTPQGIVAVAASPLKSLQDIEPSSGLLLILAAVSDPGNVGTLIRTAAAAGMDAVVLTEGSADPLNPKTARASAAALFTTTLVADVTLGDSLERARSLGYSVVGAAGEAATDIYSFDLTRATALVLGNESWGLPEASRDVLDDEVSIPMPGRMESLNVAVAGSVIVFEALRQRMSDGSPRVSSGEGGPSE